MATSPRPPRPQAILRVRSAERITPHLVRVVAGGKGFDAFADTTATDKYVKILFSDPQHGLTPPYDLERLRADDPDRLPVRRTYTVREVDATARTVTIDFVVHVAEGVAANWAAAAEAGDTLVILGASGGYRPADDAPWHLLVGDHSALPAVSSAVEAMPHSARGHVLLSVADTADRVLPEAPAGLAVHWYDDDEALVDALGELAWLDGIPQVFAHGERGTIKLVRALLREREVPRESLSISAYWARGRVEDEFQAEKREPIGKID